MKVIDIDILNHLIQGELTLNEVRTLTVPNAEAPVHAVDYQVQHQSQTPTPTEQAHKGTAGPKGDLSLTTGMNSLMVGVTSTAPGDTSSHSRLAVRGGSKQPRSQHLSRCATTYCQINKELLRGEEGRPLGQPPVQNVLCVIT